MAKVGIFNTVIPYTLFAAALASDVGVGVAASQSALGPILALVFSLIIFGKAFASQLNFWHLAGIVSGVIGVCLIAMYKKAGHDATDSQLVPFVILIAGVSSKALAAVLAQHHNQRFSHTSTLAQAAIQASAGMLVALVLSLGLDCSGLTPSRLDKHNLSGGGCYRFVASAGLGAWASVGYLALFSSCIVYALQFFLLKRVGAVRQMTVDYVTPIVGVVEGIIFRAEWAHVSWQQIALFVSGMACAFIGVFLLHHAGHPAIALRATAESRMDGKALLAGGIATKDKISEP